MTGQQWQRHWQAQDERCAKLKALGLRSNAARAAARWSCETRGDVMRLLIDQPHVEALRGISAAVAAELRQWAGFEHRQIVQCLCCGAEVPVEPAVEPAALAGQRGSIEGIAPETGQSWPVPRASRQ